MPTAAHQSFIQYDIEILINGLTLHSIVLKCCRTAYELLICITELERPPEFPRLLSDVESGLWKADVSESPAPRDGLSNEARPLKIFFKKVKLLHDQSKSTFNAYHLR